MNANPQTIITNQLITEIAIDLSDILTRYRSAAVLIEDHKRTNPRDIHAIRCLNYLSIMLRNAEQTRQELLYMKQSTPADAAPQPPPQPEQ